MWFELGKLTINLDIPTVFLLCLCVVCIVYIRSIKGGRDV
jgi:hypothetical protein